MIDWSVVVLILGGSALALGFYWLRNVAGRATSLEALEYRIKTLEAKMPSDEPVPVLPRGLPGRIR